MMLHFVCLSWHPECCLSLSKSSQVCFLLLPANLFAWKLLCQWLSYLPLSSNLPFYIYSNFLKLGMGLCKLWVFWRRGARCTACRILVPQPGIEPRARAVKVQSPNHWTARELPANYASGLPTGLLILPKRGMRGSWEVCKRQKEERTCSFLSISWALPVSFLILWVSPQGWQSLPFPAAESSTPFLTEPASLASAQRWEIRAAAPSSKFLSFNNSSLFPLFPQS